MEMRKWMQKCYKTGQECAEKYGDDMDRAIWYMDRDLASYIFNDFECGAFWEAGFKGRRPEYVQAVRYGEIPADGRSINWAENAWEGGVSCVKIIRNPEDRDVKSIYDVTLGMQGINKYIVSGWYMGGVGSDGEPLILCAKIDEQI